MNDYTVYIWSSYGATALIMLVLLSGALLQLKRARGELSTLQEKELSKRRIKDDP